MNVLALEAYYGGSHRAFLDGWADLSRHNWKLMTLPPSNWKWRMRQSAVTFADQVGDIVAANDAPDVIFCSDMLNVAEFIGLAPPPVRDLPIVLYFHENQLTYPTRFESERDYHFVVTNMTSALAAKEVWFNSAFARDEFLEALDVFLRKVPDHRPRRAVERIRSKSAVFSPGVSLTAERTQRPPGPIHILWAARWEHDKCPEDFFEALKLLKSRGLAFRLSVIGEQFREVPEVFAWAKEHFAAEIDRWGYQQSRSDYERALVEADVFVSTAGHEFFGISCVEASLAGAYPVLPKRLAYPELLALDSDDSAEQFFYDGTVESLAQKLTTLAEAVKAGRLWTAQPNRAIDNLKRFRWPNHTPILDNALEAASQ